MQLRPLLIPLALAMAAPVAAQAAAPASGLLGLDTGTTRILVEAGQKARAPGWHMMLRGLREEKLLALEQDPVDWARLVRVIESEKALEALRIHRALDAELEAFARMNPAQRKQVAASARKLRQTLFEMQARPSK